MKIIFTIFLVALISIANADESKHYEVAKEHVLINMDPAKADEYAEKITNAILMRQPLHQPFKDVYKSFFIKILTSDEYVDAYAKLYMEHLSIEDLKYANKIFKDEKMKNYLDKMPFIMEQSIILGQEFAQKNYADLKMAIEERAKEIEMLGGK